MQKPYVVGIDIGGTNVKFAELDNAGNIIEHGKIKTQHEKLSNVNCRQDLAKKKICNRDY